MDLILFDIDGTLLRTGGAGREALDEAFLGVCGWPEATAGISLAGATDGGILRSVFARFLGTGGPSDHDGAAVQRVYLQALTRRLDVPGRAIACPGVPALLRSLEGRAHIGLLTGNWCAGAALKLRAVGLDRTWAVGAYGDDAVDRDLLVPVARARAAAAGLAVRRVVVVGDTPADIRCARAGGAVAVAVETGFASPEALAAAGPDVVLADLERGKSWFEAIVAP